MRALPVSLAESIALFVSFLCLDETVAFLSGNSAQTFLPLKANGPLQMSMETNEFPSCVPFPAVLEIEEPKAIQVLKNIKVQGLALPDEISELPVETAYAEAGEAQPGVPPLILLHGFDSSCCEFRRLLPELDQQGQEAYALDILGWGFNQYLGIKSFSAEAKLAHLYEFWQTVLKGRKMSLVGASLGGAVAIEFAHRYPWAVHKLILIDGQGFIDGVGPMASLPGPVARLGIKVLQSKPLRMFANQIAYFDKEKYATEDAMKIGRLHTLKDGWEDASINYMLSGGFSPSQKVAEIRTDTLVLWGRNDEILEPKEYAEKFPEVMERCRLEWVEECGHVPHLEQPVETAKKIVDFNMDGLDLAAEKESAKQGKQFSLAEFKLPWQQ
mmetsp:Transcript_235/g.447  ORF Transcript_235/g.447 Transcript_235/m.447 type:complete len:385 (+) Transcript_235:76-1230(+)